MPQPHFKPSSFKNRETFWAQRELTDTLVRQSWLVYDDFGEKTLLDHGIKTTGFAHICPFYLKVFYKSNRQHFLWVYWRDNPLGMLGEHSKSL